MLPRTQRHLPARRGTERAWLACLSRTRMRTRMRRDPSTSFECSFPAPARYTEQSIKGQKVAWCWRAYLSRCHCCSPYRCPLSLMPRSPRKSVNRKREVDAVGFNDKLGQNLVESNYSQIRKASKNCLGTGQESNGNRARTRAPSLPRGFTSGKGDEPSHDEHRWSKRNAGRKLACRRRRSSSLKPMAAALS